MTDKEKAISIIKSIIDYNSTEKWGRALRFAVKELEEKLTCDDKQSVSCPRCETSNTLLVRMCSSCDWTRYQD